MKSFYWPILSLFITSQALAANVFEPVPRTQIYQKLFQITSTKNCKKHLPCKMLRRHLIRDNQNCHMDPDLLEEAELHIRERVLRNDSEFVSISDSMRYLGVYPGKYKYLIFPESDQMLRIRARIHIKNIDQFSHGEIKDFMAKIDQASKLWEFPGFKPFNHLIYFDFGITDDPKKAAVSVQLLREKTRGPYFAKWSTKWSPTTIAHEFGHVMGLDDEYANGPFGGSTSRCDRGSLMCSSSNGKPQHYQYYLIMRRGLCN